MSSNLHKLYYREYFDGIDWPNKDSASVKNLIKDRNNTLTAKGLLSQDQSDALYKDYAFRLVVLYPGLVTGVGIDHEARIEGEFKLGLHFDWTYGMPVIYGSSVKGVLRSYFKDFYKSKIYQSDDDIKKEMEVVFNDIFEGKIFTGKIVKGNKDYTFKSIYERDIFFDAVVVKAEGKDGRGRLLCSDSITPHGDNPLKNPKPITFLKIAPGCQIEFRFKLVDTIIKMEDGKELIFNAKDKLVLFKEILTTVGIGAKTNVGYGQLKSI